MNQYIIDALKEKIASYKANQTYQKRAYQRVLNHIVGMSDELTYDMIYDIPGVGGKIGDFLEDLLDTEWDDSSDSDYTEESDSDEEFIVNPSNKYVIDALYNKMNSYPAADVYRRDAYQRVINNIADMEDTVTYDIMHFIPGVGKSIRAFLETVVKSSAPSNKTVANNLIRLEFPADSNTCTVNKHIIDTMTKKMNSLPEESSARDVYKRALHLIKVVNYQVTNDNLHTIPGMNTISPFLETVCDPKSPQVFNELSLMLNKLGDEDKYNSYEEYIESRNTLYKYIVNNDKFILIHPTFCNTIKNTIITNKKKLDERRDLYISAHFNDIIANMKDLVNTNIKSTHYKNSLHANLNTIEATLNNYYKTITDDTLLKNMTQVEHLLKIYAS